MHDSHTVAGDIFASNDPQHAQHTQQRLAVRRWRSAASCAVRAGAAFPPAVLLVLVGVAVTLVDTPAVLDALEFGPATPKLLRPSAADWWPAFSRAALPQLPVWLRVPALLLPITASARTPPASNLPPMTAHTRMHSMHASQRSKCSCTITRAAV